MPALKFPKPDLDRIPVAMTVAGSDSGGGAGIQADLRTIAMHRVHGTSAITCITAQNTLGVTSVEAMPPDAVTAQIDAVATDIGIDAAKCGMLLNAEIATAAIERLQAHGVTALVVDPVMVSRTGVVLIDDDAIAALRDRVIPAAAIVTPNRHEAQILTGIDIVDLETMQQAARKVYSLGAKAVLVKGGAMAGPECGVDVWFDGDRLEVLRTETIDTPHTHGTGCTLSAAIAATIARDGGDALAAVRRAKTYVTNALKHSLAIGMGQGPVGHFYPLVDPQLPRP
ncbi:MAG: bifunctional hydroxymethylpyrimidine kinase/phosphomethylpyrimidine kinase [Geitlerinemataceae cyanobacterium]